MHFLFQFSLLAILGIFSALMPSRLDAQEPGWTSRVLKLGEEREVSEQTPILERPYRPLHFYGNAVRRNYYRGNPLPMPRDILITSAFLAPSSRERDLEREQRLSGANNSRQESDESKAKDKETAGEAADELAPEADAAPESEIGTAPEADKPDPNQTMNDRTSSRRSGLDAQARRSRRGGN